MDNISIRRATQEDLPIIVEMLAKDELGQTREHFTLPLHEEYVNAFANILKDEHQELMVAEDGLRRVVGTFQLSFIQYLTYRGGIRAQIEAVRVHMDHRGQGLGEMMLRWAIERAGKRKAHVVQLTTDKKRPDALRFYEKLGFKASHEGMKLHLKLS